MASDTDKDSKHGTISPGGPKADSGGSLGLSFESCQQMQVCLEKYGISPTQSLFSSSQAPSSALRMGKN